MDKYFKENLKFLRKKLKLSQQDLADKLKKINRSTISRYESGEIDPTVGNVLLISNYLDIPINDLLFTDLQNENSDAFDNFYNANKHLLNDDDKDTIKFLIEKRKANETKNKNS